MKNSTLFPKFSAKMESADGEIEALCSIWDGVHVESKLEASRRYLKHKIKSLEDESTSASVLIEMTVSEGVKIGVF